MKIGGNENSKGIVKLLEEQKSLKTRADTQKSLGGVSSDATSVDVDASEELSRVVTAESIIAERKAKVEELKRQYLSGELKPVNSRDLAKKLLEAVDDQVAIDKAAQGE